MFALHFPKRFVFATHVPERFGFAEIVLKQAVRLFLGMGPITVSSCRKWHDVSPRNNMCVRVVVIVFGLGQSRTERHLMHLLDL